ncbi:unnamed protein product [Rhizophagus irregularis]|nr:unnamed protein product [Rhizophagus irregularis]CAB5215825.1 unnamed protein product [Rhizophagus irregularis]
MADKLNFGISQNPDTKVYILNINEEFLNKVESYLANKLVFGISQNPDTKVYILYLNNNTFLNEITYLVKESYGFDNIKEIGKGGFSTVYSAIWKNGLLLHEYSSWKRKPNTKVALKRLHNSQNFLDEFINEVKAYPRQKINNILKIYGISRYPTTKDLSKYDNIDNNTVEIIDFTNL